MVLVVGGTDHAASASTISDIKVLPSRAAFTFKAVCSSDGTVILSSFIMMMSVVSSVSFVYLAHAILSSTACQSRRLAERRAQTGGCERGSA